jgi:hypothetical protein
MCGEEAPREAEEATVAALLRVVELESIGDLKYIECGEAGNLAGKLRKYRPNRLI